MYILFIYLFFFFDIEHSVVHKVWNTVKDLIPKYVEPSYEDHEEALGTPSFNKLLL